MTKTVTYGNIKYNCKTLDSYTVDHINWKTDEKIIDQWGSPLKEIFNHINLEDEVLIKLGRIIDLESETEKIFPKQLTMDKLEELNKLMIGTAPGERMVCFYQVFEPLKFRQIKIKKILNDIRNRRG